MRFQPINSHFNHKVWTMKTIFLSQYYVHCKLTHMSNLWLHVASITCTHTSHALLFEHLVGCLDRYWEDDYRRGEDYRCGDDYQHGEEYCHEADYNREDEYMREDRYDNGHGWRYDNQPPTNNRADMQNPKIMMVTADHKISDNGMRSLTITGEGRRIITDGMNNIDLVIRNDINTNPVMGIWIRIGMIRTINSIKTN